MAELQLKSEGVLPPTSLGTIILTVAVGATVNITKEMLMASIPMYIQPQPSTANPFGLPMASIAIMSHSGDYRQLLAQTNQSLTKAYFTNNSARIYRTTNTSVITNGAITNAVLTSNGFKVVGVAVGQAHIKYKAKAILDAVESTEYSTVQGTIVVNVVTNTNQPATNIDDSTGTYPQDNNKVLGMDFFSMGYSDPNNDPIWKVKILTLPTNGALFLTGVPVTVNQEILASTINSGALVFVPNSGLPVGTITTFTFAVCDTGTGIYITT